MDLQKLLNVKTLAEARAAVEHLNREYAAAKTQRDELRETRRRVVEAGDVDGLIRRDREIEIAEARLETLAAFSAKTLAPVVRRLEAQEFYGKLAAAQSHVVQLEKAAGSVADLATRIEGMLTEGQAFIHPEGVSIYDGADDLLELHRQIRQRTEELRAALDAILTGLPRTARERQAVNEAAYRAAMA